MGVFRRPYTRPVPASAERVSVKGVPSVRVRGRGGAVSVWPLNERGDRYVAHAPKWYGWVRGKPVPLCKNKVAAEQMLGRLRDGGPATAAPAGGRALADHVEDYRKHLTSKGDAATHVRDVCARLLATFEGCGFVVAGEIAGETVTNWLADRRKGGASQQTSNHYLAALKAFCRWLVRDGRLGASPLEHAAPGNVATDRRHDRRDLSPAELRLLLATTLSSQRKFRGLTGADRHALYLTACGTGYRAGGLAGLTPERFSLDGETPTVTLSARRNKSRKLKVQPLPADVAEHMRGYLKGKAPGEPVWSGTWAQHNAAEMIRRDLADAGVPYRVEGPDGPLFADFHALRHTYLTMGGRAGIDLRTLQELAGHSTPALTARYSHRDLADLAVAVAKLPPLL